VVKYTCIVVPAQKVSKLKEELEFSIQCLALPARVIASIMGRIISMSLAVGDLARLRTRGLYMLCFRV
jgi:hypothetical protein